MSRMEPLRLVQHTVPDYMDLPPVPAFVTALHIAYATNCAGYRSAVTFWAVTLLTAVLSQFPDQRSYWPKLNSTLSPFPGPIRPDSMPV
jgi:hypothetical protein